MGWRGGYIHEHHISQVLVGEYASNTISIDCIKVIKIIGNSVRFLLLLGGVHQRKYIMFNFHYLCIGRGATIHKDKIENHQIFGLICAIIGVLFILIFLNFYYIAVNDGKDDSSYSEIYFLFFGFNFILLGIIISLIGKARINLIRNQPIYNGIIGVSIIFYSIISVTSMVEAISEPHGATDMDWIVIVFIILGFFYFNIGCTILLSLHRLALVLSLGPFIVSIPFWIIIIITSGFDFNLNSFFSILFFSLCLVPTMVFIFSLIKWWAHRKSHFSLSSEK